MCCDAYLPQRVELHTYECDTTASLIAQRRDEAQIGRMCRRNLLLLLSPLLLTSIKKDAEHDGGDIRERKVREKERREKEDEEEGALERGGCLSKYSNVENMECSDAALRLQYSI